MEDNMQVIGSTTREITAETSAILARVSTQTQSATHRLRFELDSLEQQLEAKASNMDQLVYSVWQLLSQKSNTRLRKEAGIPTWTKWYKEFKGKYNLKSLRTFQRTRAKANGTPATPKPKRQTGTKSARPDYLPHLLGLIQMIQKGDDMADIKVRCDQILAVIDASEAGVQ